MPKRGPKPRTVQNSRVRSTTTLDPAAWIPPDHLSDLAQGEYSRLVKILRTKGVLDKTDPRLVELYAMNYDLLRRAYAEVETEGATVTSDRGNTAEHPGVSMINAATIRLKAIINDLGLTPASSRYVDPASNAEKPSPWSGNLKVS